MASKKPSKNMYDVVLPDGTLGQYPRVTHIISKMLAKPALLPWYYRQTRDAISGLAAVLGESVMDRGPHYDQDAYLFELSEEYEGIMDWLTDGDMLEEVLKMNRLRPEDQAHEAADRGIVGHSTMESIARKALAGEEDMGLARAIFENPASTPWQKNTASAWMGLDPLVVAAEERLVSHQARYAGTCDLILEDRIVDLKTRNTYEKVYESDFIQCGAYSNAYAEMQGAHPLPVGVLVVGEDGWKLYKSDGEKERRAFLLIRELFDLVGTIGGDER